MKLAEQMKLAEHERAAKTHGVNPRELETWAEVTAAVRAGGAAAAAAARAADDAVTIRELCFEREIVMARHRDSRRRWVGRREVVGQSRMAL
jgi:hypothetical protein